MNNLSIEKSIRRFLDEDIGFGDITSEPIFGPEDYGKAEFVAKEPFINAGITTVATTVFKLCNSKITTTASDDGKKIQKGDVIFKASGPVLDLLRAERVALNLVQRLCGIATLTQQFIEQVDKLPVKVVDTRKTTPGLRALEKYAVRVGGGHNHRFSLADGILIKDNHIAACGSISDAVSKTRDRAPHTLKIEVEAENLQQVKECLACHVDIIMLDNMSLAAMRQAVQLVDGRAILEASGGVNLENIREIGETGVNIISVGALTHSAKACDISMKLYPIF